MNTYIYIIGGNLYDTKVDLVDKILTLTKEFHLFPKIENTDNTYTIEIEAAEENLVNFEPILFKKIASFMEIRLYTKKELKPTIKREKSNNNNKDFKKCAKFLRQEKIIAIKGDNSYHLVCSASKSKAVLALRDIISQPDIPLPIVYKNLLKARHLILISSKEEALLTSEERPFVIAKQRNLHRLEKTKYKHKLTPLINEINHRIILSLPSNELYENLFEEIEFPLVSLDTNFTDKKSLLEKYADTIEHVIDSDKEIQELKPRTVSQIVYGREQTIIPKQAIQEEKLTIHLDYEKSNILDFKLKPIKLLDNNEPKHKALSLLFSKLPIEQILKLKLPFSETKIKKLHKNWSNNTTAPTSLFDLFDVIASLSGELHKKSFQEQSVMLAEEHYEVCEEDLFDFEIKDNEIDIDIISTYLNNDKLKHLGSTLVNTISTIITQIVKEQSLDEVYLSGEIFHYRDLSELTIEKLEDEDIKAILV
jgi:hydrogenase maturation factor HypF (carbamoyltransferase family)